MPHRSPPEYARRNPHTSTPRQHSAATYLQAWAEKGTRRSEQQPLQRPCLGRVWPSVAMVSLRGKLCLVFAKRSRASRCPAGWHPRGATCSVSVVCLRPLPVQSMGACLPSRRSHACCVPLWPVFAHGNHTQTRQWLVMSCKSRAHPCMASGMVNQSGSVEPQAAMQSSARALSRCARCPGCPP